MVVCGLVAGTVGAVYGPNLLSRGGSRAVARTSLSKAAPPQSARTSVESRFAVESQSELTNPAGLTSATAVDAKPADAPPSDHDFEAALKRDTAFLAELTRDHAREEVDPSWSRAATAMLRRDLERASDGQFRVVKVDCRTTMCLSTLEWPSYEQAKERALPLAASELELNCTRELLLTPPDDPKAVYQGSFFLNCLEQR